IGIAQALINDPQLIILDEPTSGLDPIGCREVKNLIRFLSNQGKTIILTSHLLSDVQDVADYAIIIYGGLIKAEGTMEDLLDIAERSSIELPSVLADKIFSNLSEQEQREVRVINKQRSLEQLFLDVVEKAGVGQKSSGAREGTGKAEYLTNKKLESLLNHKEPEKIKNVIKANDLVKQLKKHQVELNNFTQNLPEPEGKKNNEQINEKLKRFLD
ncbi:MAG: ABC transporter ATP-binding protein, partial [Lentisphaeria bacterium]